MTPTLAAITLAPAGGGVAAVARLSARVFRETWGADAHILELLPSSSPVASPSTPQRLAFGAALLGRAIASRDPVFFGHLGLVKAMAAVPRSLQPPYGVFLHGIEAWTTLPAAALVRLRRAAVVLANSAHTAARFRALNPDAPDVSICPLALEPRLWDETQGNGQSAARSGRSHVLIVARLSSRERYKGHDELLDAWPAVLQSVPHARLVIAGEGDDAPRLKARASQLNIGGSVDFTGFVSDEERTRLYAQASVFAMPSRGEGFGLVYLEAMAHRLPCIGSRQDAAGEIIRDGITGYLVDQHDVRGLADRLVHLLTNEAARQAMGEAGRARVASAFTYERFRSQIVSAIDSMHAGRMRTTSQGRPA